MVRVAFYTWWRVKGVTHWKPFRSIYASCNDHCFSLPDQSVASTNCDTFVSRSVCPELYFARSWWFCCWQTLSVNADVTIKKSWGPSEGLFSLSSSFRIWYAQLWSRCFESIAMYLFIFVDVHMFCSCMRQF